LPIRILGSGLPVVGYIKIGQASEKTSKLKGAPYRFDHIEITGRQRDAEGRLFLDPFATAKLIEQGAATCGGCERFAGNFVDCTENTFPTCGGCLWAQGFVQCP